MNKRGNKGFTIIEIMAVIIIIGLLAAMVANKVVGQTDRAKIITTKASLKSLDSAVQQFKMDTGRYPTEEEGLKALVEKPSDVINYQQGGYLQTTTVPKDAWGHEFVYTLNPESGQAFEIKSYGPDGQDGGGDDLTSTDAE
jgi:general secretion pathway protein G